MSDVLSSKQQTIVSHKDTSIQFQLSERTLSNQTPYQANQNVTDFK